MKLKVENIRSFYGEHTLDIRPITLLVGENSSGKTTALACLAAACNRDSFALKPVLDRPPYILGDFEAIRSRSKADADPQFGIGLTSTGSLGEDESRIYASFGKDVFGQPELRSLEVENEDSGFHTELRRRGRSVHLATAYLRPSDQGVRQEVKTGRIDLSPEDLDRSVAQSRALLDLIPLLGIDSRVSRKTDKGETHGPNETALLLRLMDTPFGSMDPPTISLAPIRTSPQSTYEPHQEVFDPEGAHVPFALAKTLSTQGNEKVTGRLVRAVKRFGEESGLFQDVSIRRLGQNAGDPFQVMIRQGRALTNLAHVGYGVSQSLPIVYEMIRRPKGTRVLMQQPEVHLHPRAQAALGSLISRLCTAEQKSFVIETHSDYLVDRVRQEVARGTVSAEDVVILYFEKRARKSKIYDIRLDDAGNILDAPPTYRDFFMREQLSLLGAGID